MAVIRFSSTATYDSEAVGLWPLDVRWSLWPLWKVKVSCENKVKVKVTVNVAAVAFVDSQGFLGNTVIVKVKVADVAFVEGQCLL